MGGRNREPMRKGVAKVPVVMQMEAMECGAACLAMVLAYYGKWIPLSVLRKTCGVSRDGIRLSTIAKTARTLGLEAQGYRYETTELFEKGDFPCIVHWRFTHFVVVCGRRGDQVTICDPAHGRVIIGMEEFDECFTGLCVRMRPSEGFVPEGRQRSVWSYLRANLTGAHSTIAFVFVAALVAALPATIYPTVTHTIVDRVIGKGDDAWLVPLVTLYSLLCLTQLVVGLVEGVSETRLFGSLGIKASVRYMWHLLHLPLEFFFQRQPADLQQNEEANRSAAETFIGQVVPVVISAVMMVFYVVVMLFYSVPLTALSLVSVVASVVISRQVAARHTNIVRVMSKDRAHMAAASVAGVRMAETIKAAGAEVPFFGRWAGYQANLTDQRVSYDRTTQFLGTLPAYVTRITSVALLCAGSLLIMQHRLTVGGVVAFQALLTALADPTNRFSAAEQQIEEMRADMERIEDVMAYPEGTLLRDDTGEVPETMLTGKIDLDHVTFGYSKNEDPLIKDLSLHIEAGSCVAIVGSSGSGKSTLLSLIEGLSAPWSGRITFDDRPLEEIGRTQFRASVGVIEQKAVLFHDTIANNIRMWDASLEDFEVIMAARDAHIHDTIMSRDRGYDHMLLDGGRDLSGGERQRIEIARSLALDPSILIMDEATSALDAETEARVMRSVRARGITLIIVAHRLSTIRDADVICVVERGSIVECGMHEELMGQRGRYFALVRDS